MKNQTKRNVLFLLFTALLTSAVLPSCGGGAVSEDTDAVG